MDPRPESRQTELAQQVSLQDVPLHDPRLIAVGCGLEDGGNVHGLPW
ncbi:hypothetical protein ACNKHW_25600 [Shigella flexneri]